MIVMGMLGTLEPQEEVVESESSNVREGRINVPGEVVEEDEDQEDNQENNQVEGAPVLNVEEKDEEEVQVITSDPKVQAESPTFETLSKLLHLSRTLQNHYNQFKTKKSCPSIGTPSNSRGHPLFRIFQRSLKS